MTGCNHFMFLMALSVSVGYMWLLVFPNGIKVSVLFQAVQPVSLRTLLPQPAFAHINT